MSQAQTWRECTLLSSTPAILCTVNLLLCQWWYPAFILSKQSHQDCSLLLYLGKQRKIHYSNVSKHSYYHCLISAKVSFWAVGLFSHEVSDHGWECQDWVSILDSPQSGGLFLVLCNKWGVQYSSNVKNIFLEMSIAPQLERCSFEVIWNCWGGFWAPFKWVLISLFITSL